MINFIKKATNEQQTLLCPHNNGQTHIQYQIHLVLNENQKKKENYTETQYALNMGLIINCIVTDQWEYIMHMQHIVSTKK